jgi:hypothetical protein
VKAALHFLGAGFVIVGVLVGTSACTVVTPSRPPPSIPSALLYSRPKEIFWVVCSAQRAGQKCAFYNLDGRTIAFRCEYQLTVPPTQELFSKSWLGGSRELKLDDGTNLACLAREDAPEAR